MPFLPFKPELNRYILVVKSLNAENARVTWGSAGKRFTKKEREAGINLADVFADSNPFSVVFKKVEDAVSAKQAAEKAIGDTVDFLEANTDAKDAVLVKDVCRKLLARREALREDVRALVVPIRHMISVIAE